MHYKLFDFCEGLKNGKYLLEELPIAKQILSILLSLFIYNVCGSILYAYMHIKLQYGTENEMDSGGKHLLSYFSSFPMVVLLLGISNIVFNEMTFSMIYTAEHITFNAHALYAYCAI